MYVTHGYVELCFSPFLCVVLILTIPERFGICNPYVRDVPGWIAEYVCTASQPLGACIVYL